MVFSDVHYSDVIDFGSPANKFYSTLYWVTLRSYLEVKRSFAVNDQVEILFILYTNYLTF